MFTVQKYLIFAFVFLLQGCAPSSTQEFLSEGDHLCHQLASALETIHTRDDLIKKKSIVKKYFLSIVNTAIQARKFQEKYLTEEELEEPQSFLGTSRLKEELKRVYAIDGGRELLESYEKEALEKLDLFEKKMRTRILDKPPL